MKKIINSIKIILDISIKFICDYWKFICLLLIFLILVIVGINYFKRIIKTIKNIVNKIINYFKRKVQLIKKNINKIIDYYKKEIYRIKVKNIKIIVILTTLFMLMFKTIRDIVPNWLNVHLNLQSNLDYFGIYGCILSLLLPLVILLIERINDKNDFIMTETYLRETKMFPSLIYFCTNLMLFVLYSDFYYFVISVILSMIIIIMMYYKSYKLLSNKVYERSQNSKTRNLLINEDLELQLSHFNNNTINKYYNEGIYIENYNYIPTEDYQMLRLYSKDELVLIENYDYKNIIKIVEILKKCNGNNKKQSDNKNLNVIVYLKDIGFTLQRHKGYASIYYKEEYETYAKQISKIINERIYRITEHNTHFYVKDNYEFIQLECIDAINNNSPLQLEIALKKYMEIYKDYIVEIQNQIGEYDYKLAYQHNHSIIRYRVYELLELIARDIIDYANMIKEKDNYLLMNRLISYLYQMILFSSEKQELLSIERLFGLFEYLLDIALKLKEKHSANKIKTIVFELMNRTKYDIDNIKNVEINKGILLVCNKTMSKILYNLYKINFEEFKKWFNKHKKIIDDIKEKQEILSITADEKNKLLNCYVELLKHYECNLFATTSYILKSKTNVEGNFEHIYKYYDTYNSEELSKMYLDALQLDFDDQTYSWDLLEEHDFDDVGVWSVNTTNYLTNLYCQCICRKNINKIVIPVSYAMNSRIDNIIKNINELGKGAYVTPFENVRKEYEQNKKEKIMSTPISKDRVDNFIKIFNERYSESTLYNLLKINGKINLIEEDIKSKTYLQIKNIVGKEYFLNQNVLDDYIIWDNFENHFVDAFTRAEEAKYADIISKKCDLLDKNILDYINEFKNIKELIIFKNYKSLYGCIGYENIVWQVPDDYSTEYRNIASCYLNIKNEYIPIIDLHELDDSIYVFKCIDLMAMNKSKNGFSINVEDFSQNDKLLAKSMKSKIIGMDLKGVERRNHLLSSVELHIKEFVDFDENNFEGCKFNRK